MRSKVMDLDRPGTTRVCQSVTENLQVASILVAGIDDKSGDVGVKEFADQFSQAEIAGGSLAAVRDADRHNIRDDGHRRHLVEDDASVRVVLLRHVDSTLASVHQMRSISSSLGDLTSIDYHAAHQVVLAE
jgi:hypothetical protein